MSIVLVIASFAKKKRISPQHLKQPLAVNKSTYLLESRPTDGVENASLWGFQMATKQLWDGDAITRPELHSKNEHARTKWDNDNAECFNNSIKFSLDATLKMKHYVVPLKMIEYVANNFRQSCSDSQKLGLWDVWSSLSSFIFVYRRPKTMEL